MAIRTRCSIDQRIATSLCARVIEQTTREQQRPYGLHRAQRGKIRVGPKGHAAIKLALDPVEYGRRPVGQVFVDGITRV
ncbi:MAG: hypothetical protein ACK56N_10410 [Betaproteobacteria bacterium]